VARMGASDIVSARLSRSFQGGIWGKQPGAAVLLAISRELANP
jgi:hypothetical protein